MLDINYADIANNELVSDADLGYWINSAAIRVWDFRAWDFAEGEDATKTTSAVEKIPYPTDFVSGSIWLLMIAGLGEYDKKTYQDFRKYKINYPTGTDKIYAEYNRDLYLNTAAHATGLAITLLGKNKFTKLGTELAPALIAGNWTVGAGWESPIVGPGLIKSGDGTGTQTPSAATNIEAGKRYRVSITISALSVGSATYTLGGVGGSALAAVGTYVDYITATTTGKLIITPTNTSRFTISEISISADDKLPFSPDLDDLEYSGNRAIVHLAYAEALVSRKYNESDRATLEEAAAFNILKILWAPFAEARANSQSKDRPFFNVPDFFGSGGQNTGKFD